MTGSPQIGDLGEAWASSSVNCVPFRHQAVLPAEDGWVTAFYDAAGDVVTCRVDDALRPVVRHVTPSPIAPHDAHACISLGRGPDDEIHVVFGAHASTAWHMRLAADLSRIVQPPRALAEQTAQRLTYPMLMRRDDPAGLMLLYRDGGSARGEIRVSRWMPAQQAFVPDETALISGATGRPSAGPYLNRPVRLPDGRTALFTVWRLAAELTSAGDVANVGIDLFIADADLARLTTEDGVALSLPATPYHGARAWAVPPGRNLINQASAGLAPDGWPMALSYWNDATGIPQYQLLWHAGAGWHAAPVSTFRQPFTLAGRGTLPLPHSRPDMLVRADGSVLCFFRSAEYGNRLMLSVQAPPYDRRPAEPRVLMDEDLGHYEPILDAETYRRDGSVLLYVQACHQGHGDDPQAPAGAPARLMRWPAAQVAAW
ncbi:BNR-4 repeat-containing protein [Ancylobacter sonchi]|uniref:BNR-4 repeat-containing protein n=1 Tax=Ancylobacter sonchi TaxID=1937790 RepID=UPI001BD67CE8|nr:BNR-4 repeat-containing protein [Ancylobacter sonchi]MBS7534931.1 BNR-4 repeat-containing protein [Ancylobacter sonchi]